MKQALLFYVILIIAIAGRVRAQTAGADSVDSPVLQGAGNNYHYTTFDGSRDLSVRPITPGFGWKTDVIASLYPNPARESVNVLFDAESGVRSIAVYSLLGKPAKVYKVSGGSARVDIGDVPSGVYFLRLMNVAGQVLATRKFNHQ